MSSLNRTQNIADGTAGLGILLLLIGVAALTTGGSWSIAVLTGITMFLIGLAVRVSAKP